MPTQLTPQEQVLLQEDTGYLDAGIPVEGSRVLNWDGRFILIYYSATNGYFTTDISDLGSNVINNIAQQSEVHGIWYYLPQSIEQVVSEEATTAIDAAKAVGSTAAQISQAVADAVGKALANLLGPIVNALLPVLLIAGFLIFIYLSPKRG